MSTFKETIRKQILDENRRQWTVDDTGGDLDRFEIEVLVPLREFAAAGCFTLNEHSGSYRGRKRIDLVRIEGEIIFERL